MLTSPYVADHRTQVLRWSDILAQAEEITDLWITCQKKVCYYLERFLSWSSRGWDGGGGGEAQ